MPSAEVGSFAAAVRHFVCQVNFEHAHDLFDAHLPLIRYEQQPSAGLAVRKYVLMRRGVLASDAQRVPGAGLSAAARAEIDYLLARSDSRAANLVA